MSRSGSTRLLILTSYLICPPRSGGAMRMVNPIVGLGQLGHHQATFLFQCWDDAEVTRARAYFARYPWISVVGVPNRVRFDVLDGTFRSRFPTDVLSQLDYTYCSTLQELLSSRDLDVVQVEHSQMAWVVPLIRIVRPDLPVVLDLHNVESTLFERWAQHTTENRAILTAHYQKMQQWERESWQWFDACLSVSPEETATFERETGHRIPVVELPTGGGMDLERFPFDPTREAGPSHAIVYVGTMDWFANAHGLSWFVDEVLPLVRARVPDARLEIAGHGNPRSDLVRRAALRPDVVLLGEVDDERSILERGGVFVVPLWIAAGARVKITTAWAAGIPVVATTIGAEGLHYSDGDDILIADDPRVFADKIVRVMTDAELARRLRENGRRLAEERYALATSVRKLDQFYRSLADNKTDTDVAAYRPLEETFRRVIEMKADMAARTELRIAQVEAEKEEYIRRVHASPFYRVWLRTRRLLPKPVRRMIGGVY